MFCINKECNTFKMWGSRENHTSGVSSEESVRALREATKGGFNTTFKRLIIKEALDMASLKVLTEELFPNLEHIDLFGLI